MRVGILSGGGDAPGTNAAIRAVVRKGIREHNDAFFGIKDGWRGLIEGSFVSLDLEKTTGILPLGGSILGFSRTNPFKHKEGVEKLLENFKKADLEALIVIGGDDTLSVVHKTETFWHFQITQVIRGKCICYLA